MGDIGRGSCLDVVIAELPQQCKNHLRKGGMHCKKGLAIFPSPAGMSLTILSLVGNNLPSPSPGKVWSKKTRNLKRKFYGVNDLPLLAFLMR